MAVEAASQQQDTARDQVVDAFVAAWNTSDESERWRLLEQCWAEDGVLIHLSGEYHGRQALAAYITESLGRWPRGSRVRISPVEEHHGWLQYTWEILRPDGSVFGAGRHVAERLSDGRLRRMINFSITTPKVGD